MKGLRKICIFICVLCCALQSCTVMPSSTDSLHESNTQDTELRTEAAPSEALDLSAIETVSELVSYLYQTADAPEKEIEDLEETLAPGDVLPSDCLPSVADGVVGQEICLSLIPQKNDVFLRVYSTETGISVAVITANGSDNTSFQPMLLILNVPYLTGAELFDHTANMQGTVRSVCFLDGNEYYFAQNGFASFAETDQNGSATNEAVYGMIHADGTVSSYESGSDAAERIDGVYERILTRFGVTVS